MLQEGLIFILNYLDNFKYHADITFAKNFHFFFYLFMSHWRGRNIINSVHLEDIVRETDENDGLY